MVICLYSLSERANCLLIVQLFAHWSSYFENILGWKWPIVHPGTVCASLQLENLKNHLRFSSNHVLNHTLFLPIAISPSFWCGLHLTHQDYARHPRQLVRSCLQLDRNIRRHKGWADCLGPRKSAQLCLAPSHPPPVILFTLYSISNSPSPRSTRDLIWTFSKWPSPRSSPPNLASQSSCSLAACRPRPGRREKRKWRPNWRVVAEMLLMTSTILQWLTGRQDLRKKGIFLVTASAQVIFVNEKIFALWLPSPHMHHHLVMHVDSNL